MPSGRRDWSRHLPAWARSPLGVLAVVAATALISALLATGAAERAQVAERQSTVRLLATMAWPVLRPDSVGAPIPIDVVVLNAGPEAVTVTGGRLDGSPAELRLEELGEVAAGSSRSLGATLEPECSTRAAGELVLQVRTADGTAHEVVADSLGRGLGMTPVEAARFCRDPQWEQIPVWRTTVQDDGALAMQVRNVHSQDVVLTVVPPAGTVVQGEPDLPVTLPTDRSQLIRLHLEVQRCTSAARRADAGRQVDFLVDGEEGILVPDQPTLVGWFAQRVAQECG